MIRALILGRAAGVWEEYEAAKQLASFDVLIAINKAGRDCPDPIQHWTSFHPDLFPLWLKQRRELGLPDHAAQLWSGIYKGHPCGSGKIAFPVKYVESNGGSSGMLAVDVALTGLSVDRAVLCGVPLQKTARYDDATPWTEGEVYRAAWLEKLEFIKGRVRSMSGWTRDLLGEPTREWLDGSD